jgi:hypothetical protein
LLWFFDPLVGLLGNQVFLFSGFDYFARNSDASSLLFRFYAERAGLVEFSSNPANVGVVESVG